MTTHFGSVIRLIYVLNLIFQINSWAQAPLKEMVQRPEDSIRVATWNIAMNFPESGAITEALNSEDNTRFKRQAEIIQRIHPDILLLNEWDATQDNEALHLFQKKYLSTGHNGALPLTFPYVFNAPVNTGVPSGLDLDGDEKSGQGPGDAWGYGAFPGQYSMVVLSRFPIVLEEVRTFQNFKWSDMPEALKPVTESGASWYPSDVWAILRLSSKSHWDVPILTDQGIVHLLASHPTPPVFDGPEDRNGRRNHDEIRFWADYTHPDPSKAKYIQDDQGRTGGLAQGAVFVIVGDLNADPYDGDSYEGAIQQLLQHPAIAKCPVPVSRGGREWSQLQGGANDSSIGPAEADTADFNDRNTGNLRVDYVLVSKFGCQTLMKAGVFWPEPDSPWSDLFPINRPWTSDHRPVWVDLRIQSPSDF